MLKASRSNCQSHISSVVTCIFVMHTDHESHALNYWQRVLVCSVVRRWLRLMDWNNHGAVVGVNLSVILTGLCPFSYVPSYTRWSVVPSVNWLWLSYTYFMICELYCRVIAGNVCFNLLGKPITRYRGGRLRVGLLTAWNSHCIQWNILVSFVCVLNNLRYTSIGRQVMWSLKMKIEPPRTKTRAPTRHRSLEYYPSVTYFNCS
jgi:hypothetical protein